MYLPSVTGLIPCKDVSLFATSSCPWTPLSTFYKLLEIERQELEPTTIWLCSVSTLGKSRQTVSYR